MIDGEEVFWCTVSFPILALFIVILLAVAGIRIVTLSQLWLVPVVGAIVGFFLPIILQLILVQKDKEGAIPPTYKDKEKK